MALKKNVASLDEVAEKYRGLYTANEDGSFDLDPELAEALDTSGLTSALDKERKANREKEKALSQYSKLGKVEDIQRRIAELEAAGGEGGQKWEKLKADLVKANEAAVAERDASLAKMRSSLEQHLIDAEAAAALAELKGSTRLLLPHIRSQVKVLEEDGKFVARVVDSEGDPRGNGKGGFLSIKELAAEMRKSSDYAMAFEPVQGAGGGMPPGKAKAGVSSDNMSPTQKIAQGLSQK